MFESPVEQALSGLRQLASNRMSSAEAQALCDEVAAHLDAEVQARMELGAERQRAELEAVAAFGPIDRLVMGVSEAKNPTRWEPIWLAGTLAVISPFVLVDLNSRWPLWVLMLAAAGLVTSGMASAQLKRVPIRPLIAAALVFWVGASWRDATDTVQVGDSDWDRSSLPAAVMKLETHVTAERNHVRNLEAALFEQRQRRGLRIAKDYNRDTGALIYTQASNQAEADRHWYQLERLLPTFQRVLHESEAQALIHRQALRRGVADELPRSLVGGALPTLVLALLWLVLNASIVGFCRALRRWRRRPHTT